MDNGGYEWRRMEREAKEALTLYTTVYQLCGLRITSQVGSQNKDMEGRLALLLICLLCLLLYIPFARAVHAV